MLRVLRRALMLALLAGAIVYTVSLVMVLVVSQQDQREPVDAIVVLGAAQYNGRPSPVLRARLDHALELYREGHAPVVIVTGGVGRGDTISEAAVGRRYLVAHGVPASAVVVQSEGRNTSASMNGVGQWSATASSPGSSSSATPFTCFAFASRPAAPPWTHTPHPPRAALSPTTPSSSSAISWPKRSRSLSPGHGAGNLP